MTFVQLAKFFETAEDMLLAEFQYAYKHASWYSIEELDDHSFALYYEKMKLEEYYHFFEAVQAANWDAYRQFEFLNDITRMSRMS